LENDHVTFVMLDRRNIIGCRRCFFFVGSKCKDAISCGVTVCSIGGRGWRCFDSVELLNEPISHIATAVNATIRQEK